MMPHDPLTVADRIDGGGTGGPIHVAAPELGFATASGTGGLAVQVGAMLAEEAAGALRGAVRRVGAPFTPVETDVRAELWFLPTVHALASAVPAVVGSTAGAMEDADAP